MVPPKPGTHVGPKESPTLAVLNSCLTASSYGMRRGVWKQESDTSGQRSPKSLWSETAGTRLIKPVLHEPAWGGGDRDHHGMAVSPCYHLIPSEYELHCRAVICPVEEAYWSRPPSRVPPRAAPPRARGQRRLCQRHPEAELQAGQGVCVLCSLRPPSPRSPGRQRPGGGSSLPGGAGGGAGGHAQGSRPGRGAARPPCCQRPGEGPGRCRGGGPAAHLPRRLQSVK